MPNSSDIAFAIAEVLNRKQALRIVSRLNKEQKSIQDDNGSILVRKYGTASHHLKSAISIIVDDTADGGVSSRGIIDAVDQVIVSKDAYNQQIMGNSVRIGGKLYDSEIHSLSNVTIDGDIIGSHIILGSLRASKTDFGETEYALRQLANQRDALSKQLVHDCNQLHKMSVSTRFSLNLKVGNFIRHDAEGLTLDLSYFYDQINKEDQEEIRLALNDFFNRGITGVLSRTNRPYYVDSPANLQLFTKILSSLRELVNLTHKRDMLSKQFKHQTNAFGKRIALLADPKRRLIVRGKIATGSEVHFSFPFLKPQEDGHTSIGDRTIRLVVKSDAVGTYLVQTAFDGSEQTTRVGDQLQAIEAYIEEKENQPIARVVPIR